MEEEAFQATVWDNVTAILQGGHGPEQLFQLARAVSSVLDQRLGSRQLPRVDTRHKVLLMDSSVLLLGPWGLHAAIWGGEWGPWIRGEIFGVSQVDVMSLFQYFQ